MRLPNANSLIVEREKIASYLLNPEHPSGAGKARFFGAFGFRIQEWQRLAQALREHGRENEIIRTTETGFGPRYVVEGEIQTPDGRRPRVRSVWQFDRGQIAPRLITAYPLTAAYD
jgi:hypothetical protein